MFCAIRKAILAPSIFRSVTILSQALYKNWSNVLGQHNLILTCWLVKYDSSMYSSILMQKKKLGFYRNFENWILTGVFTLLHTELHHIYYGKSSFRLSLSTLAVILLQFSAVGTEGQEGRSSPPDFGCNIPKLNPFLYWFLSPPPRFLDLSKALQMHQTTTVH